MSAIIGHVVRILDKYRLIVDAGNNILKVGDTIEVFSSDGVVVDRNGNDLGPLVLVKDRLEVIQVEDKYSICEKTEIRTVKKTAISELVMSPLLRETTETKRVPLCVNESDIQPMPKAANQINVGDPVRKS